MAEIESETLKQVSLPTPPPLKQAKQEKKEGKNLETDEEAKDRETAGLQTTIAESKELQKDKKEEEEESLAFSTPPSIQALFPPFIPLTEIKAPSYAQLSPEILALFEQISGVITVMETLSGTRETTFILDGPQFSSSIFYGSQVTIIEDKSAPNDFNIHFSGSQEAMDLFDLHREELQASFDSGEFSFSVHLIQTNQPRY